MTLKNLGLFLVGNRQAIVALTSDPRSLWLGLLLVLSAGFAREYDAEYLLAEPWHVGISLVASLIACTLLYVVLAICIRPGSRAGGAVAERLYLRFLSAFWLTAPLAWVYAIPYERLLSATDAVYANLWTLGIVAAWRVLLIVRVGAVLFCVTHLAALWPVMLFSAGLAVAAVLSLDARILAIMGGVRLNEAEQTLRAVAMGVLVLSFYSLPVWGIGSLVVCFKSLKLVPPPEVEPSPGGSRRGAWILAGVALGVWVLALPFTQPPQARRYLVEQAIKTRDYAAAVNVLCANPQDAFPPAWDPPPRRVGPMGLPRGVYPDMLEVAALISSRRAPAWVLDAYGPKLAETLQRAEFVFSQATPTERKRYLEALAAWPRPGDLRDRVRELEALEEHAGEHGPLLQELVAKVKSSPD